MTRRPLVSIVTVTYNSESTIEDTLHSVQSQDWPEIEHIIVDGNSKDSTVSIVNRFKRPGLKIISEPDKGIYDAMNKGTRLATGSIIGTLNSDDILESPEVISKIVNAFENNVYDAVYGDLVYVRANNMDKIIRYWRSRDYRSGMARSGWMPAHPTLYLKRSVFEKYGYYDTNYSIAADYDFCLRIFEKHMICSRYLPEILVRMRAGGKSNSSLKNILLSNKESSHACKKNGYTGGIIFLLRKLVSKLPQLVSRPSK